MGLTPVELEGREFSRARKGYNIEEVDKFFKAVAQEFETLYRENQELKETCSRLRQDLSRYHALENNITETLVIAQKAGEDARNSAAKEAEVIIKEAKLKAEEMIAKARADIQKQQEELNDIIKKHQVAVAEMKLFLTTHLDLLEKSGPSMHLFVDEAPLEEEEQETDEENPEFYVEV